MTARDLSKARCWRRRWEVRERAAAFVQRLQSGAYLQVLFLAGLISEPVNRATSATRSFESRSLLAGPCGSTGDARGRAATSSAASPPMAPSRALRTPSVMHWLHDRGRSPLCGTTIWPRDLGDRLGERDRTIDQLHQALAAELAGDRRLLQMALQAGGERHVRPFRFMARRARCRAR